MAYYDHDNYLLVFTTDVFFGDTHLVERLSKVHPTDTKGYLLGQYGYNQTYHQHNYKILHSLDHHHHTIHSNLQGKSILTIYLTKILKSTELNQLEISLFHQEI